MTKRVEVKNVKANQRLVGVYEEIVKLGVLPQARQKPATYGEAGGLSLGIQMS